ncbi:hypothetical protein C8F04DRAFT_1367117 [Mycena alexandri]|uniref:CxC2-like cysteine cluster KDZ transposase-associated domain-containing protein n=1 Tax=Mycena alexandri TaxID=1745969 RepID=A0AAD6SNL9_9AGAR|nr:hypothetical protein C8F04DRAFT_1367117 [Mycena alexandri]
MKRVGGSKKIQTPRNTTRVATSVPSVKVTFHTVYETTPVCDEKGNEKTEQMRESVAHMNDLKKKQSTFLCIILSRHHHSQLLTPCSCGGKDQHDKFLLRRVACDDCLQAELLCRQCWVNKHQTMPAHWAFVWNQADRFFEKHDFSRVLKNGAIRMRHNGEGCPDAEVGHSFTLVERNGIHATAIAFCGCKTETSPDGKKHALALRATHASGDFPRERQGPWDWIHAQPARRQADRFFAGGVPDIYKNFLVIMCFYEFLQIIVESGEAHGLDDPLPKEVDVPYPNRPPGFLGVNCAACPEPGVNMPLVVKVPRYLRHAISLNNTLDGNFKANLFFKRDDGSDTALTDGNMYFPKQAEFDNIAATYVIPEEDKEVPCKAHIGSIRHHGCACDHAVLASLIDMLKGEVFALGTYAQREMLRHKNTPPHAPETQTPMVQSYDSYCSFVVNQVKRATDLFPDEIWLHDLLAKVDGQADHINGHGLNCQTLWQGVYFACRGHFHGKTAEVIWAFLNSAGYLRQAQLLAAERLDAFRLFELHMAVVEELSRQHAKEVGAWSRLSRCTTTDASGELCSVYQHKLTKALSVESTLAAMISTEQDKLKQDGELDTGTSVAQWVHNGMTIERQQHLAIALLRNHQEHPLQETWDSITKLRDSLNLHLKKFRVRQRETYPWLTLSALDVDEPEVTAIQLPSYRMKHGQRQKHIRGGDELDSELRQAEIQLRCTQAESGVFAVRDASLVLSAVKKARELDYRGQGGITRSQRNLQKAELMKQFEINMYSLWTKVMDGRVVIWSFSVKIGKFEQKMVKMTIFWRRFCLECAGGQNTLIHLGHMEERRGGPISASDAPGHAAKRSAHLHRATGDSRLFDGTAWYLQREVMIADAAVTSTLPHGSDSEGNQPELLAGTQSLKRSGFKHGQRTPKRLRDIAPDNVEVGLSEVEESDPEMSPSKGGRTEEETTGKKGKKGKGKGKRKGDGWIWMENLMRGQPQSEEKLAAYKMESDQVQWFRAEAEMYRWLEQYEHKHAELMRVISRYRRDSEVWRGLADREEALNGMNGATTFARMQATMHRRLELNATTLFKSADSGAHHDWVAATSFNDLVERIDRWRDAVFKWMDDLTRDGTLKTTKTWKDITMAETRGREEEHATNMKLDTSSAAMPPLSIILTLNLGAKPLQQGT